MKTTSTEPCLGFCQKGTRPCPIPEHCRSAHLPDTPIDDGGVNSVLVLIAICVLLGLALIGAGVLTAYLSANLPRL